MNLKLKKKNRIVRNHNFDLRYDMDSHRFREMAVKPEFYEFVLKNIIPQLKLKGYKMDEKHRQISQILANVFDAYNVGNSLRDSRSKTKYVAQRIPLYDAMVRKSIIKVCIGSEISGKVSRYTFDVNGERLFKDMKITEVYDPMFDSPLTNKHIPVNFDKAPVILREKINKKNITVPFPKSIDENEFQEIQTLEASVMRINDANYNKHKFEVPMGGLWG